jgi:hypothetical protein
VSLFGDGEFVISTRYNQAMDHHVVAAISISGSCLDVLGSLYLAYDLLGGQHGPLRLLTRMVTYSVLYGLGYGLGLGLLVGLAAGFATGVTLAIEFNRASRGLEHHSFPWEVAFSAIRGAAFTVGLWPLTGLRYAVGFGVLSTVGQAIAYSFGMRPALDYVAKLRPRLSRRQAWGTVNRSIGYLAAALLCSHFVRHLEHPWLFALRVGLVTGVVTGVGGTLTPFIEYYADNLPERRMGAFGVALIFCGFALQSLQYWLALFDVKGS